MSHKNEIPIVGAGPSGLFAASLLLQEGYRVKLYDQKERPGRKFLLAGNSGLNLTYSDEESVTSADNLSPYGKDSLFFREAINDFSPQNLRDWFSQIGVETFIGSSGKVFPREKEASDILNLWLESLSAYKDFSLFCGYRLINWQEDKLTFSTPLGEEAVSSTRGIFALGGASWPQTGSDGAWNEIFKKNSLEVLPFKPMNCGFLLTWSDYMREHHLHKPLKNIRVTLGERSKRGDILVTPRGMEGGPLYWFSRELREGIEKDGKVSLTLDLTPDLSWDKVLQRLSKGRGKRSFSSFLKRELNLSPLKVALLREFSPALTGEDPQQVARHIKELEIYFKGTSSLDRAISSSGGVGWDELDESLMIKKRKGWFVAGEMIDWDAPTGGYLLQGCFSTTYRAVKGVMSNEKNPS